MEALEEETFERHIEKQRKEIFICKCLLDTDSSEQVEISARKQRILSTVSRTENYLRERRISELINFFLTKILAEEPAKPMLFLEKLLDDCMLFRAGHGLAPVIYERRHLEAVIKSFDPLQRGYLTAPQIQRAFISLGFSPPKLIPETMEFVEVLNLLMKVQEKELFSLMSAGMEKPCEESNTESSF